MVSGSNTELTDLRSLSQSASCTRLGNWSRVVPSYI